MIDERLKQAMAMNKGKPIKINYEELKNCMGYENIFYEEYLMPMLKELGLKHRFDGPYIIVEVSK